MIEAQNSGDFQKAIQVYFCKCKGEISDHIDLDTLSNKVSQLPAVKSVSICDDMCSEEGRAWLKDNLRMALPKRVIIGACSSNTTAFMFGNEFEEVGLNKYLSEQVDLRELCAWVHPDKDEATKKAIYLMKGGVSRALYLQPAEDLVFNIEPSTIVIGGGEIGFSAALQIAQAGIRVYIIQENEDLISETPEFNVIQTDENIEVILNAEVEKIDGIFGNRKVDIKTPDGKRELIIGTMIISPSSTNLGECVRIAQMVHESIDIEQHKTMNQRFSASDSRGILILPCSKELKDKDIQVEEVKSAIDDLIGIIKEGHVRLPRIVASADDFRCRGCGRCKEVCEYGAITLIKNDEDGQIAQVDEMRCEGCGACTFACCNGAMELNVYGANQVMANMLGELEDVK